MRFFRVATFESRATRRRLRAAFALALLLVTPGAARASDGEWRYASPLPATDLNGVRTAMFFDAVRHRVLLVGADALTRPPSVWALPTTGGGGWEPLSAAGTPGTPGVAMSIAYDSHRGCLLVWDAGSSTLWAGIFEPALRWIPQAVPGPGPNATSSACAFDAVHRRLWVFGGYDDGGVNAQVWSLEMDDTATWRRHTPPGGPTGRMNAVAVVDPAGDRLIVSGGRDFTGVMTPRGDVWALSLSGEPAWTPLFTADSTQDLRWFGQAAVLDTTRRRLLVVGGQGSGSGPDFIHAEVAAFDLDGSHEWSVAVPPDPTRGGIVPVCFAAYDGEHDAVFEFGEKAGEYEYATRKLTLGAAPAWSPVVPPQPSPPPRFGQATAYDPARGRWLSFGGRWTYYVQYSYPTDYYDDLRSFRPGTTPVWEELPVHGTRPPARQFGQLLHDPATDRMVLFGGSLTGGITHIHPEGTTSYFSDTWLLDPSADPPAWTPLVIANPGARDGEVMVLDTQRHRVLVFGGRGDSGTRNDTWALSLDGAPGWTAVLPAGPLPAGRFNAIGAYDAVADRLVIAGGWSGVASLDDLWELRFGVAPLAWHRLDPTGTAPSTGRFQRPFVHDAARNRVLVLGDGEAGDPYAHTPLPAWQLSLDDPPAWRPFAPAGGPPDARYGASAALDPAGDRLAFFGGTNGTAGAACLGDHWLVDLSPAPVAVGPVAPPTTLELEPPRPNPSTVGSLVRFVLPAAGPAAVEVYDLAGRRLQALDVGTLGAGPHAVRLAAPPAPGLYLVRLSQGRDSRVRRWCALR